MGEVLEAKVFAGRKIEQKIDQIRTELERHMRDEVDDFDHRQLALACLTSAQRSLEAMRLDEWPLDDVADIMGAAIADEADSGPEDQRNTILVPAAALTRAASADWDHPEPDFVGVEHFILEAIERSTGEFEYRNAKWTSPTFWETEPHNQSQKDVMLKVAPIVAEVAADLAHGRTTARDPLDAIRAIL